MVEFRLRIGSVVLGLWFESAWDRFRFARYLGRESSPLEPDLSLVLRFRREAPWNAEVPNSLFLTKTGDGNGFSAADGLIRGRYSPASREGELFVDRALTRGSYARVFEQIFFQAYWSAAHAKGLEAYLLHSSGAIRQGRGWAFTGKSGAGKSTSVQLSRRRAQVVNDEITVIDLGSPPTLGDSPFNGLFRRKSEGQAPLGGILLLQQAPLHRLTRTSDAQAVMTLAREIIPPLGLETPPSQSLFMDMVSWAERTKAKVPLYTMEFLPDPGFWDRIDALGQED